MSLASIEQDLVLVHDGTMNTELEFVVHDVMKGQSIPGMAIALTRGNELLYTRGFGEVSATSNVEVSTKTRFLASSMTQTLVAAAVLRLSELGEIELHTPIVEYLPYLNMRDRRYTQVTIAQLLSHTSGMPETRSIGWTNPNTEKDALRECIDSLENEQLIAPPGHEFHYSSIGYDILGAMVAEIAGTSFEQQIQNLVLTPLDMHDTTFHAEKEWNGLLARPHIPDPPKLEFTNTPNTAQSYAKVKESKYKTEHRGHAPSGSTLYTTVTDWIKWAQMHLSRGRLNDVRLLQPHSYDFMWAPVLPIPTHPTYSSVGSGWFIREYRNHRVIEHSGTDLGYGCITCLMPREELGVVVLSNFQFSATAAVANACLDVMLGMEPTPVALAMA